MRKLYSFSLIFLFAKFALAANTLHPALSLNAARGFIQGKCYREIAGIDCRENNTCSLLVFPKLQGQLSFLLASTPPNLRSSKNEYYRIYFQVVSKNDIRAQIRDFEVLSETEATQELARSDYLGHPVACKYKNRK